jgi:beta-keto acid cleavage enzyme
MSAAEQRLSHRKSPCCRTQDLANRPAQGQLAASNGDQVTRIRTILEALNLHVATPDEARRMLDLKGKDSVGF